MDIDELRSRYESLFDAEPTHQATLESLERMLNVRLPEDMRAISAFYSGGMIGGKSLNSIAPSGPASNIGDDTLLFRQEVDLPSFMIVLSQLDESFIVLDTTSRHDQPAVYWCDNFDVQNLSDPSKLRSPQTWTSYSDFFGDVLTDEEEIRKNNGGKGNILDSR